MNSIRLAGDLPGTGEPFAAIVALDEIGVRIGEQICLAHKRWMTRDEARRAGETLIRLADER